VRGSECLRWGSCSVYFACFGRDDRNEVNLRRHSDILVYSQIFLENKDKILKFILHSGAHFIVDLTNHCRLTLGLGRP
jgi:hypothetical protein